MKITDEKAGIRRAPRQQRSRQTVEAVLDAVERVLKREGADAITTNRIAEAAGVSIGSVYQYFPDKRSIFTALHQRHVEQVSQAIERTVAEHASTFGSGAQPPASTSLADFTCALAKALMNVHDSDPLLHGIIAEAVPESAQGFRRALQATFERIISPLDQGVRSQQMLWVLPHLLEALVHGGMAQRPSVLSLDDMKQEVVRAIRAYLDAAQVDSP
ncbi:MAG: TetR/AcrR family transcriptional regulator [Myxococcales bacterium]